MIRRAKKEVAIGRRWPKKSSLVIGQVFTSKFNREWVVTENCGGARYRIISDGLEVIRGIKEIKTGKILHPLDPTVCGRGFRGIGKHTFNEDLKRANCWRGMFKRCYSEDPYYSTYCEITVCKSWWNFQVFAEWYNNNYIDGFELDKDLKSGNKGSCYSETTCCFIPKNLNILLSKIPKSRPSKEGNKFRANLSYRGKVTELGRFDCWENALCMQLITRFAIIGAEIEELFGVEFKDEFWELSKLDNQIKESINCAKLRI